MANLIVDIGNTALKASWAEGRTLGKTFRYQGENRNGFILSLVEKERPAVMIISSVSVLHEREIINLEAYCGRLVVIDPEHKDMHAAFDVPEYLSSDRLASVVAARDLFKGKSCTVFDFGTTLTIDFIDGNGKYIGGNISPGCRTRFKSVNRYSKSLPLLDTPYDIEDKGNSTASSIESGIILGIMFEIEGYLRAEPDSIVVFTGGDAIYFAKRMKNSIFVICNFVLMGLAIIAEKYE